MSKNTLRIPVAGAVVCLVLGLSGCSEDPTAVVEPAVAAAPAAPRLQPSADSTPPTFAGVRSVELVGYELYRLTWEPADDDRSDASAIRYTVHHLVEPYRELEATNDPILTTDPGVLEVTFANEAPPGRFYVRAVDEAGNASAIVSGLAQRSRRPWVRAADGTLAARVTECVQIEPGRGACVGEEGYAAIWQRDHWETLDTGTTATLRVARGESDIFLYSALGHLFRLEGDRAVLVDLVFDGATPTLPFRQFATDHLGLRYWIDGAGQVFLGADRQFRGALRPLAVPERDACPRLRGLAFGEIASFALCEDGTAYSVSHRQPGMRWLSLTPNADFVTPFGITGSIAESDTEGILFDPTGIREVGIGGWTPLLLVDWHAPGVHPMDVPESPPPITRVGEVWRNDDGNLVAVTDLGLYERSRAEWRGASGSDGPLVGALAPTPIEPSDQRTLVYEDGAVATLRRGRRTWRTPRQLTGFVSAIETIEGAPVAVAGGVSAGVYAWRDNDWQRLASGLPGADDPSVSVAGMAGSSLDRGTLFAFGSVGAEGAIWGLDDGRWGRASAVYTPPPEPIDEQDEALIAPLDAGFEMAFELEPPPAMIGVAADELPAPPPAMEPIVDIAVDAGGHAVAVGEHQIWWRLPGSGWLYLGRRAGSLSRVALDAGETYVVIEDGEAVRCWREQCADPVQPTRDTPSQIVRSWRAGPNVVVLTASGATLRFDPVPDIGGDPMIDPAVETPPGTWRATGPPLATTMVDSVRVRRTAETYDVVWTDTGEIMERAGDRWRLEAIDASAIGLFPATSGWSMLNPRGLFALGQVREVVREIPAQ